jgi:hypothetical protein
MPEAGMTRASTRVDARAAMGRQTYCAVFSICRTSPVDAST